MNYYLLIVDRQEHDQEMDQNKQYYELIDGQIRFIYYNLFGFTIFCLSYFILLHHYKTQKCWLIFNIWLSLHLLYLLFRFIFLLILMIYTVQHGTEDIVRNDQSIQGNFDLEYSTSQYLKLTFQQFINIRPIFYSQYYLFNTKLILGIMIYQVFSNLANITQTSKPSQRCDFSLIVLISILDVCSYCQDTYIKIFRWIFKCCRIMFELTFILVYLPLMWATNKIRTVGQKIMLMKYQRKYRQYQQQYQQVRSDQNLCCICLLEFEDQEMVQTLPCSQKHCFHLDCINQWLAVSPECPICRQNI